MKTVGIIPARMAASRFPNKPLKKILGEPMILHVYKRAIKSNPRTSLIIIVCGILLIVFLIQYFVAFDPITF